MSITIRDPVLLTRFAAQRGSVEIHGGTGEIIGRVLTTWPARLTIPPDPRDCFLERVTDPDLLAMFAQVEQPVLLFDPDGELVGLFERTRYRMPEEALIVHLEERRRVARKQRGYSLAEVWKIIHEKHVGDDVEPIFVKSHEPG